ncbi:hypothetical protein GDO81_027988 [Engystomops pustulosus]|uniref:Cytochrome P450 n=1 Tax=Engystomops pustulosus TaxID=76066 RepID=A0AAV6ZJN8_ENGPU|nr:hypothetical protein GDO81_027988 [Engystomops pustulosus]
MGSVRMVVLSGYETVRSALVDYADEFSERPYINIFEDMNQGFGITFSHGENWKAMRRFTLSTLRDLGMGKRTIEDRIIEECGYLIKLFESLEGKPTDLTTSVVSAVSNIIASIIFGQRFDYQDPNLLKFIGLVDENRRFIGSPSVAIYNMFPVFRYVLKAHKKVKQNIAELHYFLRKQITERNESLERDDLKGYMDAFLIKNRNREKSNPMTYFHENNLLGSVTNLFMAGTDTTSSTLRWAISYMTLNPEIQRKVHEEIDRVIGSAVPRAEHRKNVPYTNAVIHETQRFANILPLNLPRATSQDIQFQGYYLPKVNVLIPHLESVLYDETQFEKPQIFYQNIS